MYRLISAGLVVFLTVPGCAWMKPTSDRATSAPSRATQPAPAAPKSEPSPPNAAGPEQSTPAEKSPVAAPPPSVKASHAPSPAKTKPSSDNRTVKQADTAPAAPRSPAPASAAPASVKPQTPTLDLASLEQRLRDTRAIGVFTKLSLKNQVDDLLGEFRALYQGQNKHPTPELRKRYDELLVKVLNLLQSGDPPLATAIASSREAIWSILADPEKFSKI